MRLASSVNPRIPSTPAIHRSRSCRGTGDPAYTIGVSALGALAIMSCGNMRSGDRDRESVERALTYLAESQAESGLFGTSEQFGFIYNHALATLALAEAAIVLEDDSHIETLQAAVDYIEAARNPHGGWRYDVPPSGESDTSVTAWMGTALYTARQAGAAVSTQAFGAAAEWVGQVTDPATGRCGYNEVGTRSSRIAGVNSEVPLELSEPLTAAGIFLRLIHGEDAQAGKIQKQFMLLDAKSPTYENGDCDMYYWFYGSLASHQAGGDRWRDWKRMVENAALPKQITRDDPKGSWDPDGAWGKPGGRVYATAICVLSLTTSARYAAVAGQR